MPTVMQDRRDKRVMFRLSGEEFEKLQAMCQSTNCRSFSDLVRTAVHRWIESGAGQRDHQLERRIEEIEQRLARLSAEVKQLSPAK